jgi:signal transduction histidine kinase
MKQAKGDDRYVRNFTRLLIVLGVSILIFFTATLYVVSLYFSDLNDNAYIINISGRQRMLSQSTVKQVYRKQLDSTFNIDLVGLDIWQENHSLLSGDTYKKVLGGIQNTAEINLSYQQLGNYQKQIISLAKQKSKLQPSQLTTLNDLESKYLNGMDAIVSNYQKLHEESLNKFKTIAIATLLFFIAAIYLLLFIFILPLLRKINKNYKESRTKEFRNQAVIDNTEDTIWSLDKNFNLLTANKTYLSKTSKIDSSIVIGSNLRNKFYFGENIHDYNNVFEGKSFSKTYKTIKNGITNHYELYFYPITENEKVIGCCIRQCDVTQLHKTIQDLQHGEEKLKEAQQIADFGNWFWNIEEDEIYISEHLNNIFAIPKEYQKEYLTFPFLVNLIHPDDREAFENSVTSSIKNKEPHDIIYRVTVGGQLKFIHQKGKAFYKDDDAIKAYRMAGTAQDVTKTIITNQKIENQNKELQNFIYILSHNLKRPIANILALQSLYEEGDNETNDGIMTNIQACCVALNTTIKDLNLSLSLKEISKEDFTEVDVCEILDDIQVLLNKDIIDTKAKIYTKITQDKIMGVKSYFVNIFYNLVLNSLKYHNPDTPLTIKISVFKNRNAIVVKIEDNGQGMLLTPERRKKIFDMYGRLSGKTKGKGLGLYLVKTQVEAMNGTIDVESEVGVGTTMILHFNEEAPPSEDNETEYAFLGN